MSIGKPKNEPIDLNGLMNEIENDHRITVESDAVDKRIEELRVAQRDLRQATEALEKATMTLNEAIAALKSATDSSANIVTGINNAIVNAQENTKFKVSIAQEDVELLMKNSQAVLTTDEIVMKRHFEKQAQAMEAHERRISSILSRNQGFCTGDTKPCTLRCSMILATFPVFFWRHTGVMLEIFPKERLVCKIQPVGNLLYIHT